MPTAHPPQRTLPQEHSVLDRGGRPALSFELFPPRSQASEESLLRTLDELASTTPDYVSVTAAVEGHRRRRSLDLLDHLIQNTQFRPLAHVIATGQSSDQLRELVEEIIGLGVRGLLALRGDRPEGHVLTGTELPFARHLVELIRDVESEQRARLCAGRLSVGVAAYPVRHPESTTVHQDIEILLAKQRAGADFAITQVYPEPGDYEALLERAARNGVDIPIVPGILPVTGLKRYLRICELAGIEPDAVLARRLETAGSFAERLRAGVDAAEHQARAALDAGAPGLHLYTFNEHPAVLELLDRLDLPGPAGAHRDPIRSARSSLGDEADRAVPHDVPTNPNDHQTDHQESITVTETTAPATHDTPTGAPFPRATVLGYPRIGPRRELKKALERNWAGNLDAAGLTGEVDVLRTSSVRRQREIGLTEPAAVPASFALYDQVLDAIVATGALPARFSDLAGEDGAVDRAASFTLARGDVARGPLEMTKWFDTNYHYLVPEIGPGTRFAPHASELLAQAGAGEALRPALVGPVTFLLLSKAEDSAPEGFDPLSRLEDLLPVYQQLISELGRAGVSWVQLEEPALVADQDRGDLAGIVESAYRRLASGRAEGDPSLLVATPYGDAEELLAPLAGSGVEAVHVDLVSGGLSAEQTALFTGQDAPVLVAGIVDGRNIWRADLDAALTRLESLREAGARVSVATSTSLFHVPHDLDQETALPEEPRRWLAFADQKIREVAVLARGLDEGREAIAAELDDAREALEHRAAARSTRDAAVRERAAALTESDWHREPAEERRAAQAADGVAGGLPSIPTTTIGSFPQTPEIRAARAAHKAGRLNEEEYVQRLREEIRAVITLQEELGLDVLVHGEPERNDMVQYFAENFDGFDVTDHGWVQSYGSRCTRPSILWGDVSRSGEGLRGEAFTVPWIGHAQSLTERPVKGMLTGPVTILAWSFVREDQPLGETADQVALALRDEVADLEEAGIGIVQVDEPALRELLPLRRRDHADYLEWSVRSFRVATSGVGPATQIHTHLCYSEFGEVLSAIDALDADVTSVEAARSRMELLDPLQEAGFDRGIGPGVWDIHSPRVPTVEEVEGLLGAAARVIAPDRLWANPDCGLKTRAYPETEAALTHLVEAAGRVRASVAAEVPTRG